MSAMVSGLVGAVVAFALITLAEWKQKSATTLHDGWKVLKPSWLINATIIGCTAFAALIGYFLLAGGSSRPDAATQNGFALLLLAISAVGALHRAWTAYGHTLMWRGNELRDRSLFGNETVHRISHVVEAKKGEMMGEYRLTFRDGSNLRFSAYLHGAKELVEKLPRKALRD